MSDARLRGLYAITSAGLCREPELLHKSVAAVLRGGARLVQYRDKDSSPAQRESNARALLDLCHAHDALFIVNDDVRLAGTIGADGVHLGATDAPLRDARRRLGPACVIGVSCANVLPRARAAQDEGASYVAFGRFFPSRTKPDAPQAELALLRDARRQLHLPICAIGGVLPGHVRDLAAAGADMVAAVEGVFGACDVEAAAHAYARAFVQ